jgi:hypothetical protein
MGLNPERDSTPTGLNPDRDSTLNGLNPYWDSTPNGQNSEWDSTSNFNQSRIWSTMCTYIKRMDLKRKNTDQSISVKKRLSGPQHTRVQLHVEEVGNYTNVLYCN